MRVLLTNDDGVEAEGLHHLRRALHDAGAEVVVIAPEGNRSGVARSCTPRRAVRFTAGHDPFGPVYACDGTTVDCVRGGLLTGRARDADVVVAGINHGLNPGDDTLYSGTVGAAVEAALLSRPGVAVSQQPDDGRFLFRDRGPHTFEPGARLAARLLVAVAHRPPPPRAVLNVNLPTGVTDDTSLVVTRLGRRLAGVGRVVADEDDPDALFLYGTLEDPEPAYEDTEGTDFAALAAGRVALTPISLNWDEPCHGATLRSWAEQLLEALRVSTFGGRSREG